MAIKYETPEDVKRASLDQKAQNEKQERDELNRTGIWVLSTGVAYSLIAGLKSELKQIKVGKLKETIPTGFLERIGNRFWDIAAAVTILFGLEQAFQSYRAGKQAKKTEAELARMGPQEVILPDDMKAEDKLVMSREGKHVFHLEKDRNAPDATKSVPTP